VREARGSREGAGARARGSRRPYEATGQTGADAQRRAPAGAWRPCLRGAGRPSRTLHGKLHRHQTARRPRTLQTRHLRPGPHTRLRPGPAQSLQPCMTSGRGAGSTSSTRRCRLHRRPPARRSATRCRRRRSPRARRRSAAGVAHSPGRCGRCGRAGGYTRRVRPGPAQAVCVGRVRTGPDRVRTVCVQPQSGPCALAVCLQPQGGARCAPRAGKREAVRPSPPPCARLRRVGCRGPAPPGGASRCPARRGGAAAGQLRQPVEWPRQSASAGGRG
jgi:hypothetical protein